jgi:hypothetical protein
MIGKMPGREAIPPARLRSGFLALDLHGRVTQHAIQGDLRLADLDPDGSHGKFGQDAMHNGPGEGLEELVLPMFNLIPHNGEGQAIIRRIL